MIDVATMDDLPALDALFARSLPDEPLPRRLLAEKLFDPPRTTDDVRVLIHRRGARVVAAMHGVSREDDRRGWIGLFAVDPESRRRGIATALLESHFERFREHGIADVEALAIPGNYAWPGVDPCWPGAVPFLERRGFVRSGDSRNLAVDLASAPLDHGERLSSDVSISRVADDVELRAVATFAEREFGGDWGGEVRRAGWRAPPGVFIARIRGDVVAFAAHSGLNREWGFFGPMGTLASCRGLGIGRALLVRCLRDLRDDGHAVAVIPWVGPVDFYARAVGARVAREFRRYRMSP